MDEPSLRFAELLAEFQTHTPVLILLPEQFTREELLDAEAAARLLRGESIRTGPARVEFVVRTEQLTLIEDSVKAGQPIGLRAPLSVLTGQARIPLGMVNMELVDPRVESIQEGGEASTVVFTATWAEESLIAPAG